MLAIEELKLKSTDLDVTLRHNFDALRSSLLDIISREKLTIRSMEEASKDNQDMLEAARKQQQLVMEEVLKKLDDLVFFAKDTATNRFLANLRLEATEIRYTTISDAFIGTFEWIFKADVTDLKTWLEFSDGFFWISGKAGSGKSTLMKYLCTHPDTHDLLGKWGGNNVVVASFFFWNAGGMMEKTLDGLLRSLLYQVFRQCPSLIEDVLPQRLISDPFIRDHPNLWTRQELLSTLERALTYEEMERKFCFFVDGLDEYCKDHYDLVQALNLLMRLPSVKLCVSSRPWNVFKDAYGTSAERMIRLQDFTQKDMATYARIVLAKDDRFLSQAREEPQVWDLVGEITRRAEGVFLWVHLVTRSLLRGLTEHDDTWMLWKRLNEFPTDLETYFQHILDTTETVYKTCTARALLLASYAHKNLLSRRVVLPMMSFLYLPRELENPAFALQAPLNPISPDERRRCLEKAEFNVNAWCKDLLETRRYGYFNLHTVTFTHRTVKDFLQAPNIQASLFKSAGVSFSPWESLCRLHLAWLKGLNLAENDIEATTHIIQLERASSFMEEYEEKSPIELLRQLCEGHFQASLLLAFKRMSVETKEPLSGNTLCLGLSIYHCHKLFVCNELEELTNGNKVHDKNEKAFLLYCALNAVSHSSNGIFNKDTNSVLSMALNLGADPNTTAFGSGIQSFSPWQRFLQDIYDIRFHTLSFGIGRKEDFVDILLILLWQGADPEAVIEAKNIKDSPRWRLKDGTNEFENTRETKKISAKKCIRWLLRKFNLMHRSSEIERAIEQGGSTMSL